MAKIAKISGICISGLLVGCMTSEPSAFDPLVMQQVERNRAADVASRAKRPIPTTLESPYLPGPNGQAPTAPPAPTTGPALETPMTVRMPLQEIIHRAVANNIDVKVAGYTPAIDESRVVEAEARFDPTVFNNFNFERRDKDAGIFASGNAKILTNATGLRQLLPSGGQAELRYELGWNEPSVRNQNVFGVNQRTKDPQFWEGDLILEVTQPLLRNFGNDINHARINVNRNNQRISLLDFRKQLEDTLSQIEQTYWQLVTAERVVRVNERLLQKTVDTADLLSKRIGQDVTRVQISQANASVETRTALLIRNKAQVLNLSDRLKRLMNDPTIPVASGITVLPATPPIEEPIRFERKDQIDTAMDNRLELGQQQLRIDTADITLKVADNNLLPKLDLVGSVSTQGLDVDLHDMVDEQYRNHNFNFAMGLQFEIPIGNREARAIFRRAQLQRQQALVQYSGLVQQISEEVIEAIREIDTTWDEMVATRKAVFAQEDALSAILQREEGGEALTPTFVQLKLDTQGSLAQAEAAAAEAVSNYNIALSQLELRKGTLLRYNNVIMEEENLPSGMGFR